MHEQAHAETTHKTDSTGKPYKNLPGDMDEAKNPKSRVELIEEIAEPMRKYALENPNFTQSTLQAGISNGKFVRYLQIKETVFICVILTISPSANEIDAPFWHCSMSLISAGSGRPKSIGLWMRREMSNIRQLLPEFLGNVGLKESQEFTRTISALHCYRELSDAELQQINWSGK